MQCVTLCDNQHKRNYYVKDNPKRMELIRLREYPCKGKRKRRRMREREKHYSGIFLKNQSKMGFKLMIIDWTERALVLQLIRLLDVLLV